MAEESKANQGKVIDMSGRKQTPKIPKKRLGRPKRRKQLNKTGYKNCSHTITKKYSNDVNLLKYCETSNSRWFSERETSTSQKTPILTMLPDLYPPHFKYQLPPEAVSAQPMIAPQTDIMTPDQTQSIEWRESSSSSPSLPESLRGLFETNDLKQLLDVESVTKYRLQDCHIQALATILSLRVEYLYKILDKIVAMEPNTLCKTAKALQRPFAQDRDLFARVTSTDSGSPSETVLNSQSPQIPRLFPSQSKCKLNFGKNNTRNNI